MSRQEKIHLIEWLQKTPTSKQFYGIAPEELLRYYEEQQPVHAVMPALQHSDDMCFHECPNCNCRCNCSSQPCSCCNDANRLLAEVPKRDFEWVCNECNFPNLTSSVSEEEIEQELHACINCGCFEMHKRHFRITRVYAL